MGSLSDSSYEARLKRKLNVWRWQGLHLDPILLAAITLLALFGLMILYSASDKNLGLVTKQAFSIAAAFVVAILLAQVPPQRFKQWAPWLYGLGILLLLLVLVIGKRGGGAERWLALGPIRFQPSELLMIAVPTFIASYLDDKSLPPQFRHIILALLFLLLPVLLIAKQPDLGTAIIIGMIGFLTLFFAGLNWRLLVTAIVAGIISAPIIWHFMHGYQKERVLTFINPERDPLGSGYHIIQSKIAVGSGGFLGKGWMLGTQSHLQFLPTHTTDFIFAVNSEEFGMLGCLVIITLVLIITLRALYISLQAQSTFARLLTASLALSFFISAIINMGMVIGIVPVVGVPLPFISYGGTSIVTFMAGFGIIMSIHTHRRLLAD